MCSLRVKGNCAVAILVSSCLELEQGYNWVQFIEIISTFVGRCFLFWFQNSVHSTTNLSSVWEFNAECSWLLYTLLFVLIIRGMWSLPNWIQVAVGKKCMVLTCRLHCKAWRTCPFEMMAGKLSLDLQLLHAWVNVEFCGGKRAYLVSAKWLRICISE